MEDKRVRVLVELLGRASRAAVEAAFSEGKKAVDAAVVKQGIIYRAVFEHMVGRYPTPDELEQIIYRPSKRKKGCV